MKLRTGLCSRQREWYTLRRSREEGHLEELFIRVSGEEHGLVMGALWSFQEAHIPYPATTGDSLGLYQDRALVDWYSKNLWPLKVRFERS